MERPTAAKGDARVDIPTGVVSISIFKKSHELGVEPCAVELPYSKIQVKMERPTAAKGKNTFRKISGHRESLRSIH